MRGINHAVGPRSIAYRIDTECFTLTCRTLLKPDVRTVYPILMIKLSTCQDKDTLSVILDQPRAARDADDIRDRRGDPGRAVSTRADERQGDKATSLRMVDRTTNFR